MSAYYW